MLCIYNIPIILVTVNKIISFNPHMNPKDRHYYFHFMGKKTDATPDTK